MKQTQNRTYANHLKNARLACFLVDNIEIFEGSRGSFLLTSQIYDCIKEFEEKKNGL